MREKSTEQQIVEQIYSGVVDGGDVDIKCPICNSTIAHIMVSNVNADMLNCFVVNCPFCGQEHIVKNVVGIVHIDSADRIGFIDMTTNTENNDGHITMVMKIKTVMNNKNRKVE